MKLPYRKNAFVSKEKLVNYLLSEKHPVGRSKAKFFRKHGFNENNILDLEKALREVAQKNEITNIARLPHGKNYKINGSFTSPAGKRITITTIWFIKIDKRTPSFVTAYPV